MFNKQVLIGHLGQDPKTVTFSNGGKIVHFSVATTLKWKDRETGEPKSDTQWHNIVANGGLADICEKYLKKGSKVYIEGYTRHRSYEKDGVTKHITEVKLQELKMLDSKSDEAPKTENPQVENAVSENDDLPF